MTTIASAQTQQARSGTRRMINVAMPTIGYTILVIFALIQILPFLFTISNSFKCLPAIQSYPQSLVPVPPVDVTCEPTIIDDAGRERKTVLPADETSKELTFNPTLDGYREIFDQKLPRWLFNTAFVSLGVMFLRLLFDSLAGYSLARLKFPGNRIIFFFVLSLLMIPGIVLLLPRFILLKEIGLLNSYPALIIPFSASLFGVFLMKQFFESIPKELEEAAMVDGAGRFTIFFRLILPISTPAMTALAIFSFQGMWNEFLQVLLLVSSKSELWTLPLGLSFLRGEFGEQLRWHSFLAGSVITTLPLALIFFMFQRYFVEGVSYTGLKG
ncbi:MAG: sn-glycerol-3-phosphate transport system permease protein UgpE [Chloroflexota bacterium]|nr:carbohydrate ABC transporter permease [Chloroflexota bacterium]NOG62861.1 carbohydrate ABC transporter permease [Chloroflexota bacterium]GIK63519.1 MAG: sn-glycerol-3-phosphate transport system permease protein UgpE [Chloroflexota bacterium]